MTPPEPRAIKGPLRGHPRPERPDRKDPIDSRPSDAIALALRTGSPIFVNAEVIDKAKNTDMTRDAGESERIRKWLDSLDPDDLGKYKM